MVDLRMTHERRELNIQMDPDIRNDHKIALRVGIYESHYVVLNWHCLGREMS